MKISELKQILNVVEKYHGDLEVAFYEWTDHRFEDEIRVIFSNGKELTEEANQDTKIMVLTND